MRIAIAGFMQETNSFVSFTTTVQTFEEQYYHRGDEILTAFVTRYGSEEMLAQPTKKGFNLVAWWLPWTVGGGAAAAVGLVALRWSRK